MGTFWKITFYKSPGGRCPVDEFIREQLPKDRVLIDSKIAMLGTSDPNLKYPHVEKIEDGIWELRCRALSGNYRLLYFFYEPEQAYIILHAVLKKRGRLHRKDKQTARKRMWDFLASQT